MNKTEQAAFVKKLKSKHDDVYEVKLEALDEYPAITSYFRKPSIFELGIFMTKSLIEDDAIEGQHTLLKTIFIGGDDDFFEDGMMLMDVAEGLSDIISGFPIEIEPKTFDGTRGYEIKILDPDAKEPILCAIRRPNPGELSTYQKAVKSNALTATRQMYKKCWLHGDKEILDKDEYFLSTANALDRIFRRRASSLEKR